MYLLYFDGYSCSGKQFSIFIFSCFCCSRKLGFISFPLFVFGYACVVQFRTRPRQVKYAYETSDPEQQTVPPSTRVSLPTDTAAHAPVT